LRQKLTPAFVPDAPAPTAKDREVYWDIGMPGFGLVVTKAGARSYCFPYRNTLGESRRKTWKVRGGGSDAGLTLEQARSEAKKAAGDVQRGVDPAKKAREERRKAEEERR
jgi:hypothetical protein